MQNQRAVRILNNPRFRNDSDFPPPHPIGAEDEQVSGSNVENRESMSSHTGELWKLMEGLLDTITGSLGARAGIVRVFSPDSLSLQIAGAIGLPPEVCEDESVVDLGCGVCGNTVCDKDVRLSDAAVCARRSSRHFFGEECNYLVAAPLEYRGNLTGVLTLFFAAAENVPHGIAQTLRAYAQLVAIALESARNNAESLRIKLIGERHAMANEIHDSLAHTLYYARMRTGLLLEAVRTHDVQLALKCAQDVNEALGSGQKTMREIITHFRCQMDPLGLRYALQTLVNEFRDRTEIILIYTNWVADLELPIEHELQVFHIVREALANVATHSAATNASLTVERSNGYYIFTIADNGAGYGGVPSEGHYGLMIMRERALRIGGEIMIESREGNGTRVQLKFFGSEG
jgi:two-component system nitrate/nitrite sensor histidine kinase NarX